jgi:hypothetical protein
MNLEKMGTRLSEAEITKMITNNPCRPLDAFSCVMPPMRGSFVHVGNKSKPTIENGVTKEGKYGLSLLATPGLDITPMVAAYKARIKESMPKNPEGLGLALPFKDQAIKVAPLEGGKNPKGNTLSGYVPGAVFISTSGPKGGAERPVLQTLGPNGRETHIVSDPTATDRIFYSGAWYIAVVNAYYSSNARNPGVFLGVTALIKVRDDNAFGAGSVDTDLAFSGINIDAGVDPLAAFNGGAAAPEADALKALGIG